MYKNRTTFMLILSILAMVVSITTLILFFKIIANKNEHTSALSRSLVDKIAMKENADTLTKKIDEVENIKKIINAHFVDSTKIDSFIDYLEKLGISASTEVKVESFDTSKTEKNILSVTLSVNGTFSNVINTFKLLENSPYQIDVIRISLIEQPKSINKEIKTGNSASAGAPEWQSSVSFNVLTL